MVRTQHKRPFETAVTLITLCEGPIKEENDGSSHAGHTQCTNGSGQMVREEEVVLQGFTDALGALWGSLMGTEDSHPLEHTHTHTYTF